MRQVKIVSHLEANDLSCVQNLIDAASRHDGASAIGEHKFLRVSLGEESTGAEAVMALENERLVGYANTEAFPIADGLRVSAELVVHPQARRRGVASDMLRAILSDAKRQKIDRMDAWAYHQLPGTRELAAKFGFQAKRTLFQIRMPLPESLPNSLLPDGVAIRSFQPGEDDAEWLALNNLVFATHPEQGAWDAADLSARLEQPWFDARDFLVATNDGRLVAYNWLKLDHTASEGEIYVIGVHPDERRQHFGRSLSILGLEHMRQRGMREATAYVDEENRGALAMYYALGFQVDHADLCYSKSLRDSQPD